MLSYIPFKREVAPESTENKLSSMSLSQPKPKEGLYDNEEGKVMEYKDRVTDQEDIKNFVNMVFDASP